MINFLKSVRKHLSIPLGILTIGVLTFLFGPGQCAKKSNIGETNMSSDFKKELKISSSNTLQQTDKYPLAVNFEADKEVNLIDSIISYNYKGIETYIENYGLDSVLTLINKERYGYSSDADKREIVNFVKILLIRKEYNVDAAFKGIAPGLIIIEKDDKYGFINNNGDLVQEPFFQNIEPLYFHPFTAVQGDTGWGLIDSFGIIQVPMNYDTIDIIMESEDFGVLIKDQRFNLFDLNTGKFKYRNLKTLEQIWMDYIVINIGDKYGLFDLKFNRLLDRNYDKIELVDGGDGNYIKVKNGVAEKYYNLDLERVPNPIVN